MNTARLAQRYDTLTPWERIPLMLAASVRGDDVEHERLARLAPKNSFRVADFWGLAEGISRVAQLYVIRQLDLVALFWKLSADLELEPFLQSEADRKLEDRLLKVTKMVAYLFVVRTDGWKHLCRELHLDPDVLLRQLPGYNTLEEMEQIARPYAFKAEEALAYVKERFRKAGTDAAPGEYRLDTAEDVARSMRESLQEQLDAWR